MAIHEKAKNQNEAIVKKVEKILVSTDFIDTVRIVIEGSRGEIPTIQYNIKEWIVPDKCEEGLAAIRCEKCDDETS